jgi:hypothetical protein
MSSMATNLARAQHRLKKAKAELAEVRAELLVSQGELKESKQQLKATNRLLGRFRSKSATKSLELNRAEEQFRRDQALIIELLRLVNSQGRQIIESLN